jgi:hypothetical protein
VPLGPVEGGHLQAAWWRPLDILRPKWRAGLPFYDPAREQWEIAPIGRMLRVLSRVCHRRLPRRQS